jgi:hypothetical protein
MGLVTSATPGWTSQLEGLPPGDHAAVLTGTFATGVVGRLVGMELRDAMVVMLPGPDVGLVFLFRKPLSEPTVAAQTLKTGTGGLDIGACRVGSSGGTRRSGQALHPLKDDGTEDRSHHWARVGHTVVGLEATGRWAPNVLLVHSKYEWYALRHDAPREVVIAVHAHFGAREELRAVRNGIQRDAQQDRKTAVLQPGVRWVEPEYQARERAEDGVGQVDMLGVWDPVRVSAGMGQERSAQVLLTEMYGPVGTSGESTREEAFSRVHCEDDREPPSSHGSGPSRMERGEIFEPRVRLRGDFRASIRGPNPGESDDVSHIHRGTSSDHGEEIVSPSREDRVGSPLERDQARQQPGQPCTRRQGESQPPPSGDRNGTPSTARRESHLEVASWALPDRFRPYFVEVGVGGCRRVGSKRVKASNPMGPSPGNRQGMGFGHTNGRGPNPRDYADEDGLETVPEWECVEGCPVPILDAVSGELTSGARQPTANPRTSNSRSGGAFRGAPGCIGSSGGASRFYPQFENDVALIDWLSELVGCHPSR